MKIHTIALVAHDNRKHDLIEWVRFNRGTLEKYRLICTGTTGRLVQEALEASAPEANGTIHPDLHGSSQDRWEETSSLEP